MELLGMEFVSALAAIIVIDLVLAGDNAIVIALSARNVPRHLRRRAVIWGTVGAIVIGAVACKVVHLASAPVTLRFIVVTGTVKALFDFRVVTGTAGAVLLSRAVAELVTRIGANRRGGRGKR